jgi:transcriptional regulator with XRE-family HTH domain
MTLMTEFGIGARMRAARHIAGFRNVADLASAIQMAGLGETRLRQIEQERIVAGYRDLRDIAEACGLRVEWFSADFDRLDEISDDPRQVLARETAAAVERARARRGAAPEGKQPPQRGGGRP